MRLYFLDSSALVKRYAAETGSAWIRALADPAAGHHLIIARVSCVEVLSALARRPCEGSLAAKLVQQSMAAFRHDLDMQYQVTEFDRDLAEMAGELVARYPLRAYDAVQLATAFSISRASAVNGWLARAAASRVYSSRFRNCTKLRSSAMVGRQGAEWTARALSSAFAIAQIARGSSSCTMERTTAPGRRA